MIRETERDCSSHRVKCKRLYRVGYPWWHLLVWCREDPETSGTACWRSTWPGYIFRRSAEIRQSNQGNFELLPPLGKFAMNDSKMFLKLKLLRKILHFIYYHHSVTFMRSWGLGCHSSNQPLLLHCYQSLLTSSDKIWLCTQLYYAQMKYNDLKTITVRDKK